MSNKEPEQVDFIEELEPTENIEQQIAMFTELWKWLEKRIYRINRLKGWLTVERRDGELISLIHSELSECLEALRKDNPPSKKASGVSHAEEELADVIIRIMDLAFSKKWDIPKAIHLKMEYNKTRPYRHGNKRF